MKIRYNILLKDLAVETSTCAGPFTVYIEAHPLAPGHYVTFEFLIFLKFSVVLQTSVMEPIT